MTMPLVDLAMSGFILSTVIMREKIWVFEEVCESPVEWGAFEGTFACEFEATNSRTYFKEYSEVFQNSWIYPSRSSCTSKCKYFTHSVNVHVNTKAKGNPMKAAREGSIILRFEIMQAERVREVIERPGVFRDRDKLGRTCVCVTISNRKFQ